MISLMTSAEDKAAEELAHSRFKKACQGDRDAFWALMESYKGLIYSVAFGVLKDHEQSQDILHDVYLEAYKSINNLRTPKRLASWLYALTRNLCCDIIRKKVRAEQGKGDIVKSQPKIVSIQEVLIKEEDLKLLDDCIKTLPEPFRIILGMKYMNRYSCKEISAILEIGVEAVKSRLFEARKLLAQRMEESEKVKKTAVNGGNIK